MVEDEVTKALTEESCRGGAAVGWPSPTATAGRTGERSWEIASTGKSQTLKRTAILCSCAKEAVAAPQAAEKGRSRL